MRVLHLIDHLGLGGSQTLLADLLETRSGAGEREVWTLTDRVLPATAERLRAAGVAHRSVGLGPRHPLALARLRSRIRAWRPDIVHAQLDVSNTVGAACVLSLGRNRPRLVVMVENDPARHYPAWARRALGPVVARADACLVVSPSLRDAAHAALAAARRVVVLAPGIDLDRFRPGSADPEAVERLRRGAARVIGSLGRLSAQKGFDVLIEALPAILEADPAVRVLIAGEGPDREAMQARAAALGVEHALHLPGYIEDPREVLEALDVMVLPSRHEGFGLVFLEAMAMGVPVVGTRVVGSVDAVRDGQTGVLVEPEDPRALAGAVLGLLASPGLRAGLVEEAKRWVREHGSRRRMVERVEALYRELLAATYVEVRNG